MSGKVVRVTTAALQDRYMRWLMSVKDYGSERAYIAGFRAGLRAARKPAEKELPGRVSR